MQIAQYQLPWAQELPANNASTVLECRDGETERQPLGVQCHCPKPSQLRTSVALAPRDNQLINCPLSGRQHTIFTLICIHSVPWQSLLLGL